MEMPFNHGGSAYFEIHEFHHVIFGQGARVTQKRIRSATDLPLIADAAGSLVSGRKTVS